MIHQDDDDDDDDDDKKNDSPAICAKELVFTKCLID
jgi:hypothetical protein